MTTEEIQKIMDDLVKSGEELKSKIQGMTNPEEINNAEASLKLKRSSWSIWNQLLKKKK